MDNSQSNLTDETLSDASRTSAADGQTAVEQSLSLAELEATLGKKFPDKATALKAVKDTFSFVGKRQDAAADPAPAQVPAEVTEQLSSLKAEVFYANHPEYKGHEAIIKAMGSDPAEVVSMDAFKTYFEKAKVADEATKAKSVVSSNSRIAQSQSSVQEGIKLANSTASISDVAEFLASQIREGSES